MLCPRVWYNPQMGLMGERSSHTPDGARVPAESRDYFLLHPPRQPKKEIADWVESKGILVPRRFSSLDHALNSKKPFIIRSEHPQDYNGASGILDSYLIDPAKIAQWVGEFGEDDVITSDDWSNYHYKGGWHERSRIKKRVMAQVGKVSQDDFELYLMDLSFDKAKLFGDYSGVDLVSDTSYSYWEALPGLNRTVIADNAVEGRYHIFTSVSGVDDGRIYEIGELSGHEIIEGRKLIAGGRGKKLPEENTEDLLELVDFYESVRQQDERFDKGHSYLKEAKSTGGKNYFLQTMRTNDFSPAIFSLDREPERDEIASMLVRGITPPEGLDLTLAIQYPPLLRNKVIANADEAQLSFWGNTCSTEASIRQRQLQIVRGTSLKDIFVSGNSHFNRSLLFKPRLTVVLNNDDVSTLKDAAGKPTEENRVTKIKIKVVSDGRKAFVKLAA